jgi:hypothetical protein
MDIPDRPVSLLRRALPYLFIAVLGAAAYDAWIFYSRWNDRRDAARARQAKVVRDARRTLEMVGGGDLKVVAFYASPAAIRRGEHASLCYGVTGAKSVRLTPPVEDLHPALSHCLQVSPRADTHYELVAEDGAGHSASASLVLRVAP